MHSIPIHTSPHLQLLNYCPSNVGYTSAKYDLPVTMSECANGLRGNFNFPTSLFRVSTVSGFLASYRHILKQLTRLTVANSCNIGDISAVDEDSYCDLKAENRVRVRPLADRGMTLHESFENEAEISE